jgi:hypothetical protein
VQQFFQDDGLFSAMISPTQFGEFLEKMITLPPTIRQIKKAALMSLLQNSEFEEDFCDI